MPGFNGSGDYIREYDWTTDAANGVNIEASRMDTEDDGFATGLSNCITKDGQTTTTAAIPFASGIESNTVAERSSGAGVTVDGLLIKDGTVETEKGSAVASASTTNIWTAGNFKHITGTTTITSFGTAAIAGAYRIIEFDGALTLTHGANLDLPGDANIATAAGDRCMVVADTTTAHRVLYFTKAAVAPATSAPVVKNDFDAKGDILAATANNAYTNLAVGSDTFLLFADSGESSGLNWGSIDDLTEETATSADYIMIYDDGNSDHRKSPASDFINNAIFTESYTSTGQTITSGGALTLAHGLSGIPKLIQCTLKNTTTEGGYSVNDEVVVNPASNSLGGSADDGISLVMDATNVNVRFGADANAFNIIRKDTGAELEVTNSSWQLIVRAWY